ncbi:MAG TPA: hypothetical protein VM261_20120 [Kofleriaceae bacterium]|nr:hypothetical protein [Kofleriaceae bacterium]
MRAKNWPGLVVAAVMAGACGGDGGGIPHSDGVGPAPFDPGGTYSPQAVPGQLAPAITNALFPAPVGASWSYRAQTDEGVETIEVRVLSEARTTWGAMARVVRDTAYLNDVMIEDTYDWYAQDPDGNVWYLGEDTTEYVNGQPAGTAGAWEAGVDGALPGVVMLGAPQVGMVYRQEYYAGEAEDVANVERLDASVTVPAGSWSGCLETRDRSAIDPELDERKFYCPGVGNVLVLEGGVRVELIEYAGL